MKVRHLRLIVAAALLGTGGQAMAQAFMPSPQSWANIMGPEVWKPAMQAHGGGRALPPGAGRAPPSRIPRTVSLSYRRNPAVSRQVEEAYIAYVGRLAGPQGAQEVRSNLAGHDFVQIWAQAVGSDGFHPGDIADAMAAYWALNWSIANGATSYRASQAAGARAQVRAAMLINPNIARFSEAQRQQMAETYMLNFLYQLQPYADAMKRGDRALAQRLGDAAETRFRNEAKLDLRGLALTPHGFVQKG